MCDNRARLPMVTLPFTVMYRLFTASRLGWSGIDWDKVGYGIAGNRDKQDCLGDNGTVCEAASIQVKDMVLKDAIEERRSRNAEAMGS